MTAEQLAGWSAVVAAIATVLGAVFLGVFFQRGGWWGPANDVASVVLMVATIPIAIVIGVVLMERVATFALLVTGIGILGMAGAATSQVLLLARVRTYEQLLPWTLGFGAVVGLWYVLAGVVAQWTAALPVPLPWLMLASGLGFILVGYGFAQAGQQSRLAIGGGVLLLVASTACFAWLGSALLGGDLVVPEWNQ